MAGWTPERAATVKAAFYDFLNQVEIKSKEDGAIILGQHLYGGQRRVIEAIFDGLANDKHDFKVLKSRQLGISTIIRALMLFWMGVFGLTGTLMFDSNDHLDEARTELLNMLDGIPDKFAFPRKGNDSRYRLSLVNNGRIQFRAAGVKQAKGGQGLGIGSANAFSHRSELCNYGNPQGLEAFRHSLARKNPDRLFIDESTALGFNIWHDIWEEAKLDHHCVCVFCGWWSHPGQVIERADPDFEKYGLQPPTTEERGKIQAVWDQYQHQITVEQLAWIRREMNPTADADGDLDPDWSGTPDRIQHQPWTEEDAFQMTGAVFFDPGKLSEQFKTNIVSAKRPDTYTFFPGIEFTDFRAMPAHNARSAQLKVWEEPVEESVYIVAADPAFGHSDDSDRSAITVLRCFADGVDQVAEYAWPLINTRQFAWVIAAIEGWYGGDKSEVYRIIEVNGPGEAVWRELVDLKQQIARGYFGNQLVERGLQNIQRNVRNYLYSRSDSIGQGSNAYHFKTSGQLKVAIMERLRDFTSNGMLKIRSVDTLEEMRTISREGDSIKGQGVSKDDRVMAIAMGVRCWDERVRRSLINRRVTRASDAAKRRLSFEDQFKMFNQNHFDAFMAGQGAARRRAMQQQKRAAWRG